MKTNYTIEQDGQRLTVKNDGKIEAKGFLNEEDALHAIWCLNRKNPNHFYNLSDGVVYLMEVEDDIIGE